MREQEEKRIEYQRLGSLDHSRGHRDGRSDFFSEASFLDNSREHHPGRGIYIEYGQERDQRNRMGRVGAPPYADRYRRIYDKVHHQIDVTAQIALKSAGSGDIPIEAVENTIEKKEYKRGYPRSGGGKRRRGESGNEREQRDRRRMKLLWNNTRHGGQDTVFERARSIVEQKNLLPVFQSNDESSMKKAA